MSVTSGFFESVNGDRKYNSKQMSELFDGIINDGVFANVGDSFSVKAGDGINIRIGMGRAWFNSTWLYNDSELVITCPISDVLLDRVDAVVIEIDRSDAVRTGSIKVISGKPADVPTPPVMVKNQYVHQYPLAYITRKGNSSTITQAEIQNKIGTSDCPYVTGILEVHNIDNIVAQWEAQWTQWLSKQTTDTNAWQNEQKHAFDIWFDSIKGVLAGDVAATLASKVAELQARFATLAREHYVEEVKLGPDGRPQTGPDGLVIKERTTFLTPADLPQEDPQEKLIFKDVNVPVSSWGASTTYKEYPFEAKVTLAGCAANHVPSVTFGVADATSGIFAPVCEAVVGGVKLYSKETPKAAVVIPSILLIR